MDWSKIHKEPTPWHDRPSAARTSGPCGERIDSASEKSGYITGWYDKYPIICRVLYIPGFDRISTINNSKGPWFGPSTIVRGHDLGQVPWKLHRRSGFFSVSMFYTLCLFPTGKLVEKPEGQIRASLHISFNDIDHIFVPQMCSRNIYIVDPSFKLWNQCFSSNGKTPNINNRQSHTDKEKIFRIVKSTTVGKKSIPFCNNHQYPLVN